MLPHLSQNMLGQDTSLSWVSGDINCFYIIYTHIFGAINKFRMNWIVKSLSTKWLVFKVPTSKDFRGRLEGTCHFGLLSCYSITGGAGSARYPLNARCAWWVYRSHKWEERPWFSHKNSWSQSLRGREWSFYSECPRLNFRHLFSWRES